MKKKKREILLIDDEKDFVEMVEWNLEKTGRYNVTIETKPECAFDVAKKIKPDLILLDVMMPSMDGGDVNSKLKSDQELKDIPVVFLTAIVKEEEI